MRSSTLPTASVRRFERALELVRQRGAAAQLCVIRDGEVVLDRSFGCRPDALFWAFSASKPFTAVVVHRLAARGLLDLDAPVAAYWPDFASHDKAHVTVRHVLRHRSGFATGGSALGDVLVMPSWSRSLARFAGARLQWETGATPAYQFVGFGVVLGEVLQRVTGRPIDALVRDEVLAPAGLDSTFLGLPAAEWARGMPVRAARTGGSAVRAMVNRRSVRSAVIPSAGISTTARDLARFYAALLEPDTLLSAETLAAATAPTSDGEIDRFTNSPIRWAEGFQLGGADRPVPFVPPLGTRSSPLAFGHNGSNCCIGWADPSRGLAFAYVTSRISVPVADIAHHAAVADAVLDAA